MGCKDEEAGCYLHRQLLPRVRVQGGGRSQRSANVQLVTKKVLAWGMEEWRWMGRLGSRNVCPSWSVLRGVSAEASLLMV